MEGMQAHKKCVMKTKQRKNDIHMHKNYFDGRKEFIRCIQKSSRIDYKELQVNNF